MEAGNDMRAALICFALDASHGYERTHVDSLIALARLVSVYMQSPRLFERDEEALGPIGDLPASEYERIDEEEPKARGVETSGAAHGKIPAPEPAEMAEAQADTYATAGAEDTGRSLD
jgi:hypothetical protein